MSKLVQDDTQSVLKDDSGLYDSNATGQVTDIEDADDEDYQGHMTNPDKAEENSTLDMAHKMGLYTESTDDGDGAQEEIGIARELDEVEEDEDEGDDEENL